MLKEKTTTTPNRNSSPLKLGNKAILLPYCDLLFFLSVLNINQLLLHWHLLDEKNAVKFVQKPSKNIMHLIILSTILVYLTFAFKLIFKKNVLQKQKTSVISIAIILIISNILFMLKSVDALSLPHLPLFMMICFLAIVMILRGSTKKQLSTIMCSDENVIMFNPSEAEEKKNRRLRDELIKHKQIESIQVVIALFGIAAIIFEIIYEQALKNVTIKAFELEGPQWVHHFCIAIQISTIIFITGCLIARKMPSIHFLKKNHCNDTKTFVHTTSTYNSLFKITPILGGRDCSLSTPKNQSQVQKLSCFDLRATKSFQKLTQGNIYIDDDYSLLYDDTQKSSKTQSYYFS